MFRKCLAGRPYPQATRETQLSPFVLTLRIPVMCKACASFYGMLSRKLPAKTLQSSIAWVFTNTLSLTQPLQVNPTINTGNNRLNNITIKFGIELKPTKHIVENYNFTDSNLAFSNSLPWSLLILTIGTPFSFCSLLQRISNFSHSSEIQPKCILRNHQQWP